MALPLTLSGFAGTENLQGPFKSSAGNYYLFGQDSVNAYQVRTKKATDPSSSWADVGVQATTGNVAIKNIRTMQVGDVIHFNVAYGSVASSSTYSYWTFDMATDSWVVTNETAGGGATDPRNGSTDFTGGTVVVRSNGNVVFIVNGARSAGGSNGTHWLWSERTAANTWTAWSNLGNGTTATAGHVYAVGFLGAGDRVHCFCHNNADNDTWHRALLSNNTLGTMQLLAGTAAEAVPQKFDGYTNASGKFVLYYGRSSGLDIVARTATSGDAPTWAGVGVDTAGYRPVRIFYVPEQNRWYGFHAGQTNRDLYLATSTDDGVSWSAPSLIWSGITVDDDHESISEGVYGPYNRAGNVVLPFAIKDAGVWKYNEWLLYYALVANGKTVSSPTFGTPSIGQKHVLTATGKTTSSPSLGTPTLGQKHVIATSGKTVSSPALATPALTQKHVLAAAGKTVSSPALGTPALTQKHVLTATGKTVSSPVVATPTITQKHALTGSSTATAPPVFGTPTAALVQQFILGQRPIEFGLSVFQTECNKVYLCSDFPLTYTEATSTYAAGNGNAAFGAPAAATGPSGRKVTTGNVNGTVTATANAAFWAAVDTATSRLLAAGKLVGSTPLTSGSAFSLDGFTIHQPRGA
jgi:hypothetical protein